MKLSYSNVRQNDNNTKYDNVKDVKSVDDLKEVTRFDHVVGLYKDNTRNIKNFISCDCVVMDCDNDTDNTETWLTPEKLSERLKDVTFCTVYSRNHMKQKGEKSARPRFHAYFPLKNEITDAKELKNFKEKILKLCPDFDKNCIDSARFIYGVENPETKNFEGKLGIDEFFDSNNNDNGKKIPEGERNSELFNKSQGYFMNYKQAKAERMIEKLIATFESPLPDDEIHRTISNAWNSDNVQARLLASECIERHNGDFKAARADFWTSEYDDDLKKKAWIAAVKLTGTRTKKQTESKEEKQPKRNLNAVNIERKINELGIDVKFNAITHEVSVKNIPLDSEYVFDGFRKLSQVEQEKMGGEMLPVVLKPMLKDESFKFSESFFDNALSVITMTHEFNPVIDALHAVKWDGKDRLQQLYEILGIQGNSLYQTFVKKWLWQAIAIAHNDKEGRFSNDFILVLRGRQGVGKSTFFQVLVEGLLGDSELFKGGVVIDTKDKDCTIATTTKWIAELAELDSTLAKQQSDFKDFITRRFDEYRIPYGKEQKKYPRYTVFGATVNPSQFLTDTDEGTRRYATVEVDETLNHEKLRELLNTDFYKQLWRQVFETCYMVNPKGFFMTQEERRQQEQNNEKFSTNKPFEDEILDSLDWNAPIEAWQFYTSTQVKLMLQEQNILPSTASAEKIGRALSAVVNKKQNAEKKRISNQRLYKLPPIKPDVLHNFEVVEDVEVDDVQHVEVATPVIDVKEREKLYDIKGKIRRQGRYFTGGYDKQVFEAIQGLYTVVEVQKAVERLRDEADTQIGKNFYDGILKYIIEMNTKKTA